MRARVAGLRPAADGPWMAALLWALERHSCTVRSPQAAPADPLLLLRGRQQAAGARVALRCRGRLPRAVNNFHSAIPCGWHSSKPRRGAIWCHSDTTQICVTPQKCFWHQRAMGCLVSTLLSCSGCFRWRLWFFALQCSAPARRIEPHRLVALWGHERGAMAVHNVATQGRLARAIEHFCSLRAQWLCCSLSYSEPASDRACMRCTHTTCPAVLHLFTAGSVGWNPSHIQPFILQCWISGELSFYAHCNDPLQHSALSPTAWQRFRVDQWGQWRYNTGRLQGAVCAGDWPACGTPYVAQSCAAHGCFSLVRQGRPTPQRPGDIVRITRRAQRANSAKGTAA